MMEAKNGKPGSSFRLVVAAACAGAFAVAYNTTAVMTALPAIRSSLDLDVDTLQWVINLYMLFTAATLAAMGHFADTFGMMRMFVLGLCAFALGSVTIAFSGDAAILLAGRAFQGLGVAAVMATSVALISVSAPQDKRASAHGLWAGTMAVGFALGPLIGGTLTDVVSWRAIFWLDLIILAAAGLLCLKVVRARLVPRALNAGGRTDFAGIALLFLTLAAFLYGLTSGPLTGWTSVQTLGLFTISLTSGAGFIVRELRTPEPLIEFGYLRHANYVVATIGMFLNGATQMGILYFTNLFLQAPEGLNLSAAQAGLALLPFTFAMFAVSLTAPRLIRPGRYRIPLTFGMLALALGFWLMHGVGHQTPYGEIWWKLAILGAGVGFNFSLLPRAGLSALPDTKAGQGSGVLTTFFYTGLAAGTAFGGVVVAQIKRGLIDPVVETLARNAPDLDALKVMLVHGSQSQVARAMTAFPAGDTGKVENVMLKAFDGGFAGVMVLMVAFSIAGAVLCAALIRPQMSETPSNNRG